MDDSPFRWISLRLEYIMARSSTSLLTSTHGSTDLASLSSSLSEKKRKMWQTARRVVYTNLLRGFSLRMGVLREELRLAHDAPIIHIYQQLLHMERLAFCYESTHRFSDALLLYDEYELELLSWVTSNQRDAFSVRNEHLRFFKNQPIRFFDCEAESGCMELRRNLVPYTADLTSPLYDYVFWRQIYLLLQLPIHKWKEISKFRLFRYIANRTRFSLTNVQSFYFYALCDGLLSAILLAAQQQGYQDHPIVLELELVLLGEMVRFLILMMEAGYLIPPIILTPLTPSQDIEISDLISSPFMEAFRPIFHSKEALATCFLGLTHRYLEKQKKWEKDILAHTSGCSKILECMGWMATFYWMVLGDYKSSKTMLTFLWNTCSEAYPSWSSILWWIWKQLLYVSYKSKDYELPDSFLLYILKNDELGSFQGQDLWHMWSCAFAASHILETDWEEYSPFDDIEFPSKIINLKGSILSLPIVLKMPDLGLALCSISVKFISIPSGQSVTLKSTDPHLISCQLPADIDIHETWILESYNVRISKNDRIVSLSRVFAWTEVPHVTQMAFSIEPMNPPETLALTIKQINNNQYVIEEPIRASGVLRWLTPHVLYSRWHSVPGNCPFYIGCDEPQDLLELPCEKMIYCENKRELTVLIDCGQLWRGAIEPPLPSELDCLIRIHVTFKIDYEDPVEDWKERLVRHVLASRSGPEVEAPRVVIGHGCQVTWSFVFSKLLEGLYYICDPVLPGSLGPTCEYWSIVDGQSEGPITASSISVTLVPLKRGNAVPIPKLLIYNGKGGDLLPPECVTFYYDTARYVNIQIS